MFFAYCPDVKNGLKARLAVRERHLERWKKDLEAGRAGKWGVLPLRAACSSSLGRPLCVARGSVGRDQTFGSVLRAPQSTINDADGMSFHSVMSRRLPVNTSRQGFEQKTKR